MAGSQTKQKGRKARTGRRRDVGAPARRKTVGTWSLMYTVAGALLIFAPGIAVLIAVGMAPTIVAGFVDSHPMKSYRQHAIAAFNAVGVAPYAIDLWSTGRSFQSAGMLLADVYVWFMMYAAAGVGRVLLWLGPYVAAYGLQILADERLRKVLRIRKTLIDEWGADIAGEGVDLSDADTKRGRSSDTEAVRA